MSHKVTSDNYYSAERTNGLTIYDIWEQGEGFGDSITPSTHSSEYQEFITSKITSLLGHDREKRILSIGSGNAFIESSLHKDGYSVLASDPNPDAMRLAKAKSVPFVLADARRWTPERLDYSLIYCDGVMGHLYTTDSDFQQLLLRLKSWLAPGGSILISNDAALESQDVYPHPSVEGFYWFSADFISSQLSKVGFRDIESGFFLYSRPISGSRERLIVHALS